MCVCGGGGYKWNAGNGDMECGGWGIGKGRICHGYKHMRPLGVFSMTWESETYTFYDT